MGNPFLLLLQANELRVTTLFSVVYTACLLLGLCLCYSVRIAECCRSTNKRFQYFWTMNTHSGREHTMLARGELLHSCLQRQRSNQGDADSSFTWRTWLLMGLRSAWHTLHFGIDHSNFFPRRSICIRLIILVILIIILKLSCRRIMVNKRRSRLYPRFESRQRHRLSWLFSWIY
jgi:hypothetical protein